MSKVLLNISTYCFSEINELKCATNSTPGNIWGERSRMITDLTEAVEIAKQGLSALITKLKRYASEAEPKRINGLFSKDPSRVFP